MPGIPREVADLLRETRYGVSFPDPSGCQMRFYHNGKDLGGFYSYVQWGGVRPAVEAAISRNQALRAQYRRNHKGKPRYRVDMETHGSTGVVGVCGSWYEDKRRGTRAWRYQVSWRMNGVPKSKIFHLAESATPDQFLHALRTAIQFRKEWEEKLDDFDPARYRLWRVRRLYEPGAPLLPEGFFETSESSEAA